MKKKTGALDLYCGSEMLLDAVSVLPLTLGVCVRPSVVESFLDRAARR